MADGPNSSEHEGDGESTDTPPEAVAGGSQWHPLTTAAVIGGAIAATAGAYLGTRALARRNTSRNGKPLNSVMATAITASDLANKQSAEPPSAAEIRVQPEKEPSVTPEPAVVPEPGVPRA